LRSRSYEGRDGQLRFVNEITLTDMHFLGSGAGVSEDRAPYGQDAGMREEPSPDDVDDLPF
jgi:single-stranded DNA-binding protein